MLLIEEMLAAVELVCHSSRNLVGAFSDKMMDNCIWIVCHSPVGPIYSTPLWQGSMIGTPAEIDIFAVHKEIFVEAANLIDQAFPNHQRSSRQPVDISWGGMIPVF